MAIAGETNRGHTAAFDIVALRARLLGSAAVLLVAGSNGALAITLNTPCNIAGLIETCTGNQAAGVVVNTGSVTTLNVNSLTAAIAPASGLDGISFSGTGNVPNVIVNADTTGTAGIATTSGGVGIRASSLGSVNNFSYGNVTVTSTGTIKSDGDGINAISGAQSYYGFHGGNVAVTASGTITSAHGAGIIASSRGDGNNGNGAGGNGGNVTVNASGAVTGANGGISAGSSGGSPYGVSNGGNGGTVTVTATGAVTSMSRYDGIRAYSNGGNGGNGSSAGNGGAGGDVTVNASGIVTGNGQWAINAFSKGGKGYTGGNGGNIVVNATGPSLNGGGIYASSRGGAGNYGNGGNGGNVTVTSTGAINSGRSDGIHALSYGGNGYNGSGGNGGNVTVTNSGPITVTGTGSRRYGIYASSYAGSSNNSNGIGGAVTVTTSGNVTSAGNGGVGIGAFTSSGGSASVTVQSGSTVTGGGNGYGVWILADTLASLTNYGTITTSAGILGIAVAESANHTAGTTTVNNYGTLTGRISLNGNSVSFNNFAGAVVNAGSSLSLPGGTFTNNGTLSPGGNGVIQATNLNGNFVQGTTGKLAVDVNLANTASDRLSVTGTANLGGTIVVTPTGVSKGTNTFTVLTANGGVTNAGLGLFASAALNAQLVYPNINTVEITTSINYATSGLTLNQNAVGSALNPLLSNGNVRGAAQTAQAGTIIINPGPAFLTALLNPNLTPAQYQAALNQLSPEVYNQIALGLVGSAQQFGSDMMSCRVGGDDGVAIVREGQCLWVRARARSFDHGGNDVNSRELSGTFSTGAQFAVAPNWRLGFAAGYESSRLSTSTNATSTGDTYEGGAVIKYNPGPLLLAASITGGWSTWNTTRPLSFGGFNAIATSSNDADFVSGRLHASYLISQGNWYLKPIIEGAVTRVDLGGFTEANGSGAALTVNGAGDTFFSVSPALEVGTQVVYDGLAVWRPFLRGGVSFVDNGRVALDAGFASAPSGTGPFRVTTNTDTVFADVSAGVDVIGTNGITARLQYDGRYAEHTEQSGFSLKASVPF